VRVVDAVRGAGAASGVAWALAGCAGGTLAEEESIEDHACEQRAFQGATVVGAAEPAAAPLVEVGEEPFTVTLTERDTTWFAVEAVEDTAALLFAGDADVVTHLLHDGDPEPLPPPSPNEVCPDDIPEHRDLDLHPGTWHIGVGPAGISEVWLMLAPSEHAHEGEE
jgi:hypothetical protein